MQNAAHHVIKTHRLEPPLFFRRREFCEIPKNPDIDPLYLFTFTLDGNYFFKEI
jgi:hypothetical protein